MITHPEQGIFHVWPYFIREVIQLRNLHTRYLSALQISVQTSEECHQQNLKTFVFTQNWIDPYIALEGVGNKHTDRHKKFLIGQIYKTSTLSLKRLKRYLSRTGIIPTNALYSARA